jgi:Ca2+/Na+ antiporter
VPLALIVLAFVGTLSSHKLTEREGRLLKLMSGVMMLELGLVMTLVPQWLNSLGVTTLLVLIALLVLFVAAKRTRPDHPLT